MTPLDALQAWLRAKPDACRVVTRMKAWEVGAEVTICDYDLPQFRDTFTGTGATLSEAIGEALGRAEPARK